MSKNNKIRVDFSNGQAAQHVTGSCIYLPDYQILLECGLSQSNSVERDFKENNENFNFSCKKLEYIFIGHCHLDHIGRIPLLYKRGCKAKIIAPRGSYKIMKNMFEDSVKILEHDAILLSKQKGHNYEPLYTQADIDEALKYVREYPQKELIEINDKLSFRFVPSGHIKYAAQIELFITHNNVRKKLGYTSDLGNYILPKRFTESFEPIEKCDILIGEATYSSATRTTATPSLRERDLEKIKSVIQTCCIDNQAKLLVPCFALDRTPEMFMVIRDILKQNNWDIPVVIDSPLAVKQFYVYAEENPELMEEVFNSNSILCSDWMESQKYQKATGPWIIISASGMLTAGRVLSYLPRILSNPLNFILFCGYSTEGTLANEIKSGRHRYLTIAGKKIANRANIVNLHSFSSHMQHDQLLEYYSSVNCNKIFLIHSQQPDKVKFAAELKQILEDKFSTTQVVCVNKNTEGRF